MEEQKKTKVQRVKKGQFSHPLHKTWDRMNGRCNNVNDHAYANYGGRGIKVCERWSGKYGCVNFIADMGNKPSPEHTLDRIDNDGDYSPENCRWATKKEQGRNARHNKIVEVDGQEMTLMEAVEKYSERPYHTVWGRLKRGYTIKEALQWNNRQNS